MSQNESNEKPSQDSSDKKLLKYIEFNQENSSLLIGTEHGYEIVDCDAAHKDDLIKQCSNNQEQCTMLARLFTSSLVAFVSYSTPRRLSVNHFKKGTHICAYTYMSNILRVLLNRERLVVVTDDKLSIHMIKDMELIHTITDTPPNLKGVCALANNSRKCFLAFPGCGETGMVQIFDAYNLKCEASIKAHDSALECLQFNSDGSMLATASIKGTVIRVWSVDHDKKCEKLFELRRGLTRSVTVHSMNFSNNSEFLLLSSNTETIHCFKLDKNPMPSVAESSNSGTGGATTSSYYDYVTTAFTEAVNITKQYIPSSVSGIMTQDRAFAWATLPSIGTVTKVALIEVWTGFRVMVVNMEGMVYIYDINLEEGGEMNLVRQHQISNIAAGTSTFTKESEFELTSQFEPSATSSVVGGPVATGALNLQDSGEFPPV